MLTNTIYKLIGSSHATFKGHVHIHIATNNVESTLFLHPPTPDNVDRYSAVF